MTKLPKSRYYEKLTEFYYDNVHWDEPNPPSIYEWLKREFGAETNLYSKDIKFSRQKDATFFTLRWA